MAQRLQGSRDTGSKKWQFFLWTKGNLEEYLIFNGIAQKVFNRPEVTKIHLDVHGSYLWPFIDGERTVMDLAALEKERFGEAAEPLYPRIVKYFQILENNHFVSFK